MPITVRPYRAIYLFASLAVGLIIAYFHATYGNPYTAVIVTFLLVQFDVTLRR